MPYWFTLFGGEENMTREKLASLLKRPKNLSSELRVKYACLLLVDGLFCRRSLHMKKHAEMIRNLDYFLNYPWGRHSFDMTMQCIKSRSFTQLAQSTVDVQGFMHALQLVVLQAVPAASLAVGDGTDPESGDEESCPVIALKLDKLWELDEEDTVDVISILPTPGGEDGEIDDYSCLMKVMIVLLHTWRS
ncbi:unnamed protein product [Arabis nemorensis]|uniref:DUF1985 domain-containing protein n=1 Tax=Arabis nemorensis TaxID=586526 RepID=A0A565CMA8_9BRAS|nr:unnamed protein product [Arabis nemorensis]